MDFSAALNGKSTTPAPVDPFDMAPVKARFADVDRRIDEMVKVAEAHVVTDEATLKQAVSMAGQAKTLDKEIEVQRKAIVDAPNRYVRSVNGFCKDFQARAKRIEAGLKLKIGAFQHEQEMARREAERKAQEEAKKLQKKLDAQAAKKGIEAPTVQAPVMPEPESVTRTETGAAAYTRKQWTFDIEDPDQVPHEYCTVDERKIRDAVKAGVREIPGVKIYEDSKTILRTV